MSKDAQKSVIKGQKENSSNLLNSLIALRLENRRAEQRLNEKKEFGNQIESALQAEINEFEVDLLSAGEGLEGTGNRRTRIDGLKQKLFDEIDAVPGNCRTMMAHHERQFFVFYRQKINEVYAQFEKQFEDFDLRHRESFEDERKLMDYLAWVREISARISHQNAGLLEQLQNDFIDCADGEASLRSLGAEAARLALVTDKLRTPPNPEPTKPLRSRRSEARDSVSDLAAFSAFQIDRLSKYSIKGKEAAARIRAKIAKLDPLARPSGLKVFEDLRNFVNQRTSGNLKDPAQLFDFLVSTNFLETNYPGIVTTLAKKSEN